MNISQVIDASLPPSSSLPFFTELTSQPAPSAQGEQQLNGLQGLVDSVLEVLPQDQMLATFFDKIEADQQFSKLIDSIGTPKFSRILQNLQVSWGVCSCSCSCLCLCPCPCHASVVARLHFSTIF